MTKQHPITPPPELVEQWASEFYGTTIAPGEAAIYVATKCAQWGADMQFEACGKAIKQAWEMDHVESVDDLLREFRAARRPKPPSLKEQALEQCNDYIDPDGIIRRALERLPN